MATAPNTPTTSVAVPVIIAATQALPYIIEGVNLLAGAISALNADEIDPNDQEAMAAAIQKYRDSAGRADQAISSLEAAIAAKRAQQNT